MYNDQERLQQMEDNFNAGDNIYQALGLQLDTVRQLAREVDKDLYGEALQYYLDEGYPQELAEELASKQIEVSDNE